MLVKDLCQYRKLICTLKKVLLCVWWNICGIIYDKLLPLGQTITAAIYCEQLETLNQALASKHPALVNRKCVIMHHENASPYAARQTQQKLIDLI